MDLSVLRKQTALALGGLLALSVGAGSLQASSYLSASATAATPLTATGVTCATLTGPPALPQSFTLHAFGAPTGFSIVAGFTQIAGLQVTPPSPNILTAATNVAGLVFKVNSAPGCGNANGLVSNTLINGANTIALPLTAALNGASAVTDNSVTVTDTIATGAGTSALVAAPVTITCGYNATGPVYVPGTPRNVAVTSAANLGTPFTVTTGSLPTWLQLGPAAPAGAAGTTAVNFTVQATTGCGGFTTTQTYALPLASSPAPAITVLITLHFTTISPLTVTPVPAAPSLSMSYTKGSGTPATQTVNVTSSISTPTASTFYQLVNFPTWLTVNSATGFIPYTTGTNLIFSTTIAADSLAPGTYTTTIYAEVANYADEPITITLLVANKAPTLSVTSANPMPVLYTLGGATPVSTITIVSTDSPIPYTISFGGLLAPTLTANEQLTGIAFSFGTNIAITYNPVLFETSAPGTVLSGTVTFTWGPPATASTPATVTVVTINLTVGSPAAVLTGISPASLPTAAPGSVFSVNLTGSGFVGGTDPTLATKVGLVTGSNPATVNQDSNFHLTWINPSNMTLQITVPALSNGGNGDTSLPFLAGGGGGPVYIGVVNGSGTTPTGTTILTIGSNPIIYGVTSSSSFTEVSGGALPSLAPYDMFSVFGASFCSSVDTFPAVGAVPAYSNSGCGTSTILPGNPDPVFNVFPFALTPDSQILPTPPASSLWRNLSVTLYPHGTLTGGLPAPLLFATNGQINAIVPGAAVATDEYDVVVKFGPSGALASSAPFPVNIVATDPGVFTIGSDGQGPAAALANPSYALINSTNPAGMRSGSGNSDTIQLYVTGLGVPPSPASSTCAPALTGTGNYLTALNTSTTPNGTFGNIDGAVIEDTLLGSDLPPCLYALTHGTQPTATIGGQAAVVSYAAFVGDTVAGLYQMNIQLPSTTPAGGDLQPDFPNTLTGEIPTLLIPMTLPIYVTVGGHTSQAGVVLSVAPELKMVASMPASATVGVAYTGTITATLGTSTYSFAVTSGVLPAGLALVQASNVLTIAGLPAQNTSGTYNFTITATDSAAASLTGSVTVTITVAGGLYVTSSAPGPFTGSVFGSAGVGLPTITAIGGTGPYAYAVTTSTLGSAPVGMSAPGAVTGVFATTAATPGGTYLVTVTATDSLGVTGSVNFTDTIALLMNYSVTTATPPSADTTAIGTFTTTGNYVTPVHYTSSNPAFTIVDGTGVVSITGLSDGAATATITATDTGTPPGAVAASHATQTFVINITVTS
jgi:uncharacterized protein (TIGR03437 family)